MLSNKLQEIRENKDAEDRGFTLIELLVVVVIIGILIAIAIPLYLNYQKGAKDKSAQSDLRAAISTLQQCYADNNNTYPAAAAATGSAAGILTGTGNTGGTAPTDMTGKVVFQCGNTTGSTQEIANLSTSTHMSYSLSGTTATLTAWNTDGNKTTSSAGYTWNSGASGSVQ